MSDLNVLLISIDSLRRDCLGAYETSTEWVDDLGVKTPSLDTFAERAAVFDTHYVGSLPCMPARREWLTGLQEFLWRPWGPIESYDETLVLRARKVGVLTQLITDHFHYFQHGSDGYYEDYHGFEFVRGHEDDAWKTAPYDSDPVLLQQIGYDRSWGSQGNSDPPSSDSDEESAGRDNPATNPYNLTEIRPRWSYARNVDAFDAEEDFFTPKVFDRATRWIRDNRQWNQWFLYIDEFDVHEPFHCPEPYASM
jgi:arylsulfatase A-like enzyme